MRKIIAIYGPRMNNGGGTLLFICTDDISISMRVYK